MKGTGPFWRMISSQKDRVRYEEEKHLKKVKGDEELSWEQKKTTEELREKSRIQEDEVWEEFEEHMKS